jgi:HSP20 family protein
MEDNMHLMKWQPVNEMMELNDLFNRSFQRNGYSNGKNTPRLALDIYETEENLVLRAALPGAKKEDIRVELEEQLLTVTAEVTQPELPENAQSLLSESNFGQVTRTLRIPHRLDVDNSKGTFVDGVLEVTFPKAPEARRKSITIE